MLKMHASQIGLSTLDGKKLFTKIIRKQHPKIAFQ